MATCNHLTPLPFKGLIQEFRLSKIRARTGQTDTQTDATESISEPHLRVLIVAQFLGNSTIPREFRGVAGEKRR